MRTFATKQTSNQDATHQKPVRANPVPLVRSLSTGLTGSAMLQRQPGCACGGGCPRCQESSLQSKLKISEPGDRYEQEADHIADEVMRMPEPSVQRQMGPEEDEEEGMVQRKIADPITPLVQRQVLPGMEEEGEEVIQTKTIENQAAPSEPTQESSEVPASVHEVLRAPGQPLDLATRAFMEPRFGHDFSRVRVHSDAAAEQSARDVNARAYTVGHDIVFGADGFAPGTHEGQRLLAHELTHVVQQTGNTSNTLHRQPTIPNMSSMSVEDESTDLPERSKDAIKLAYHIADGLMALDKFSQTMMDEEAVSTEQEANATENLVQRSTLAELIAARSSPRVMRLPDQPGNEISPAAKAFLQSQQIPIWATILASPTLRPRAVQDAARNRTLLNFKQHPGSSFLGAIGEAIVWKSLVGTSAPFNPALAIFVIPQPAITGIQILDLQQFSSKPTTRLNELILFRKGFDGLHT